MVNLFQYLRTSLLILWSKKPSDTPKDTALPECCKIAFYMFDDGNIEIDIDWPSEFKDYKQLASNYAALISVINYGGFKEDIKKMLLDAYDQHKSTNKQVSKFLMQTLNRLSEADKITALNSDKPIVGPRQAFRHIVKQI